MRTKTILPEFLHLPIISGVEVENLAPGQKVRTFEMQSALELVRLNADSTRFQVRNIDVAKGYCLVVTDQKRAQITFGLDRVDQQLERLNRLLDHLEPEQREIQTVNLLVERNVPVTFAPDEPVELEPPSQLEPVASGGAGMPAAASAPVAKAPAPETKKALPVETRKAVPATSTKKSRSEPVPSKRKSPADSVKKPFRLNVLRRTTTKHGTRVLLRAFPDAGDVTLMPLVSAR